jgi:hypothetical protein
MQSWDLERSDWILRQNYENTIPIKTGSYRKRHESSSVTLSEPQSSSFKMSVVFIFLLTATSTSAFEQSTCGNDVHGLCSSGGKNV